MLNEFMNQHEVLDIIKNLIISGKERKFKHFFPNCLNRIREESHGDKEVEQHIEADGKTRYVTETNQAD